MEAAIGSPPSLRLEQLGLNRGNTIQMTIENRCEGLDIFRILEEENLSSLSDSQSTSIGELSSEEIDLSQCKTHKASIDRTASNRYTICFYVDGLDSRVTIEIPPRIQECHLTIFSNLGQPALNVTPGIKIFNEKGTEISNYHPHNLRRA